jgi:hypothetical protein
LGTFHRSRLYQDNLANSLFAPQKSAELDQQNHSYIYPGTVGCVGLLNKSDLRKFVSWFDSSDASKVAIVDWGLGTVEVQKLRSV